MIDTNGQIVNLTNKFVDCKITNFEVKIETSNIIFKMYMKQIRTKGRRLIIGDASSLRKSHFDASNPTYIITHGWLSDETSPACVLISEAYLMNNDSNVIVVDWSYYGKSLNYIAVANNVVGVAEIVEKFIRWLMKNGLMPDNVTLIGHSLGAHVMGIAGFNLTPKVKNVVGLDPALPMFNFAGNGRKITVESAEHVQIIHTNGAALGDHRPCGHIDFYVNGGMMQPGCGRGISAFPCCHTRAVEYFAESISTLCLGITCDKLPSLKVVDCGERVQNTSMGGIDLASSATPVMYYVPTNSKAPFCSVEPDLQP